jgi:hypothetical protein
MNNLVSLWMSLATWLMPDRHSEWSRAMNLELEHIRESERAQWAFGCLIAALRQRFTPVRTDSLRISPWVLLLELTLCFVPITYAWIDTVMGTSGIIHLNSDIISRFFLDSPLNTAVLAMMISGAIVGIAGPIGLFLALRAIATGEGLRRRMPGLVLISTIAAYGIASIALRLIAGPGAYAADLAFFVLVVALPILGIAHLMHWTRPKNQNLATT